MITIFSLRKLKKPTTMFIQIGGKKELTKQEAVDSLLVLNNLISTFSALGNEKAVEKIQEKIYKLLDLI